MTRSEDDVIEPAMERTVLPTYIACQTTDDRLMKLPSIPSALALSILAALIVAMAVMRPFDQARAGEAAARCEGYKRLTIMLGNTDKIERFSMRLCMEAVGRR